MRALRLRLHLGEADRSDGAPAGPALVARAREAGLAGATLLRATLGYGAHRRIHAETLIEVEGDLPLRLEVVDSPTAIAAFLPAARRLAGGCRADVAEVVRYMPEATGAEAEVGPAAGPAGVQGVRAQRLCVYCGEADRFGARPLVAAIVEAARREGLAGASAWRGVLGYGPRSSNHPHALRPFQLSQDLPVLVEIVDSPERIAAFLPVVGPMVRGGLITLEETLVLPGQGAHP